VQQRLEAAEQRGIAIMETLRTTSSSATMATTENADSNEEVDALDAYMDTLKSQFQQQEQQDRRFKHLQQKAVREDIDEEEDDTMETYIKWMRSQGIVVGKGTDKEMADFPDSGDEDDKDGVDENEKMEELYVVDERGNIKKKDIDPLPPVDHSIIEYSEFDKEFYEPHPDLATLSSLRRTALREELKINVYGSNVPAPCISFAHFQFDEGNSSFIPNICCTIIYLQGVIPR
jgi:ATP-dependent RNA helicase DDX42